MVDRDTPSSRILLIDDGVEGLAASARDALGRQAQRFNALVAAIGKIHAATSFAEVLALSAGEARELLGARIAIGRLDAPDAEPREEVSLSSMDTSIEQIPMGEVAWLGAALHAKDGSSAGSLRAGALPGASFRPSDEFILAELARAAAAAIERARSTSALQNAVQSREDVLAVVAHDLRNPLNTISMSTALLRQDVAPRDLPLIERIHRAMNRINRLIGDLLDASSIEQGRLRVAPRSERAAPIVLDAIDATATLAAARGCRIETDFGDGGTFVLADRDRLVQVLSNLLANAIKFSPESGVVSIGVACEGPCAVFFVADEGPGIDAAHVARLFDRYGNIKVASRSGVGLGLFIARAIVEAHNGQIRVESEPQRPGTRISFAIPLAAHA